MLDTRMVFLIFFSKKVDLKKSADDKKHEKIPRVQSVKIGTLYEYWQFIDLNVQNVPK